MKQLLSIFAVGTFLIATVLRADTGTSNLTVDVGAEASLVSVPASTTLTASGTTFNAYTGTTSFSYKIRTTDSTGSGSLTAYVSTDFSDGSNSQPSVGTPLSGVSNPLTYTCSGASSGTPCGSTQNATTNSGSATTVASFGAGAHSALAGDSVSVLWSLVNDPRYKVGAYTATVTYTISAL